MFIENPGETLTEEGYKISFDIDRLLERFVREITTIYDDIPTRQLEYSSLTSLTNLFAEHRLVKAANTYRKNKQQ